MSGWGTRCEARNPAGQQCVLPAGHEGDHRTDAEVQPPAATAAAAPRAVPAQTMSLASVAVLLGGILYAAGSALPWISITAAFVGTVTRSGLEGGDGIITIGLGIVLALVGLAHVIGSKAAGSKVALILVAVIAVGFAIFEISTINNRIAGLGADIRPLASVGIGLWMMVVGSVVALVASLSIKPKVDVGQ